MVNSYTVKITQYLFKKAKPPKCNPLLPLVIMHKSSGNTPPTNYSDWKLRQMNISTIVYATNTAWKPKQRDQTVPDPFDQ